MNIKMNMIVSALLAAAVSIGLVANPASALSDTQTATYSTTWDETPGGNALLDLGDSKSLLVTAISMGDVQNGVSAKLVASTTGSDATKFDQTTTIVQGALGYEVLAAQKLADSRIMVVYRSTRYLRHVPKSEVNYVTSSDSGTTWSEPTALGQQNATESAYAMFVSYARAFVIRQDSNGATYIFGLFDSGMILGYWHANSLTMPTWKLEVLDLIALYSGQSFGSLVSGEAVASWENDQLSNLSPSGYGATGAVSEATYGNYDTTAKLLGSKVILRASAKRVVATATVSTNGNRLAALAAVDKKGKLSFSQRVYSLNDHAWSTKSTTALGSAASINLDTLVSYLADNGDIAITYTKAATKKVNKRWMRVLSAGTWSNPIEITSVSSLPVYSYGSEPVQYFGGTKFRIIETDGGYYNENQDFVPLSVAVYEGDVQSLQTMSLACSQYPQTIGDSIVCINAKPGNGIEEETEAPNLIDINRLYFTALN